MAQAKVIKVPFVSASVTKCKCPGCPVQGKSVCVKGKMTTISQALAMNPLKRADIPGVYCSSGTATCPDLDPSKTCMCGTCPVFTDFRLSAGTPVGYFCRDGSSR